MMNRFWLVIVAYGIICASAIGYPEAYGPFERGSFPNKVQIRECVLLNPAKEGGKRPDSLSFVESSNSGTTVIRLQRVGHDWDTSWRITVAGKDGKPLGVAITNDMPSDYVSAYTADLNQDGVPDFMINIWSGGCGLAAEGSTTTFLLSVGAQYACSNIYTYDFETRDIVQFKQNGPYYYIQTDVLGNEDEKTRDGRAHNFWVHQLYRFSGSRMVAANKDDPRFPKWVWYSFNDNHKETDLLTASQKKRLLKEAQGGNPVKSVNGNLYYSNEAGEWVPLTSSGRDDEAVVHPGGEWVYFVRGVPGRFDGEKYCPPPGWKDTPGPLKEELWRVKRDGTGAKMLYRHDTRAIPGPDPDFVIASISNIQFSPDGGNVYFETSQWATSAGLRVMNADGSGQKLLGAGNDSRIIHSAKDKKLCGCIVTMQHRDSPHGGLCEQFYLFTPDLKKEISSLGSDVEGFVDRENVKF